MTARRAASLYAQYVDSSAESYERYFVPAVGEPVARMLVDAARPRPGERILDVACGTGIASRVARRAVGSEGAVVGLDANPGMLQVARTVTPEAIEWVEAPAEDLPLPDGSFDLVLCSMGLQFFTDRPAALREMRRVLVPGGRVAWCTPGPTPPLFEAIDAALNAHIGPGASMFVHAVFSLHDADEARNLMEAAALARVNLETTSVSLRVPPPADFFWQYVHSTPLAAATADLSEQQRLALEADVVERCAAFFDGETTMFESRLTIATGSREDR